MSKERGAQIRPGGQETGGEENCTSFPGLGTEPSFYFRESGSEWQCLRKFVLQSLVHRTRVEGAHRWLRKGY